MSAILWILFLAILWGVTGALVGLGLQSMFGGDNWIMPCGSLNVALGMILLQLVTRSERARKLLYEGKAEEDYLNLGLAALWGIPVMLALLGILWWVLGKMFS